MKDIADMLGIAESTVSRALNGQPGVGQELREKILRLADRVGYQPNALARALARGESFNVGVLIPDIESIFFTRIFKGIEEAANQAGYHVLLGSTDNRQEKVRYYLNLFNSQRVDGNIIIGEGLADADILRLALDIKPLVLINCYLEEMLVPSLLVDHEAGGYLATDHLLEKGCRSVVLLNGPENEFISQEILSGYSRALEEQGLKVQNEVIIHLEHSRQAGYRKMCQLMEGGKLPSAVFAASEALAVGAIEALKIGGLYVPEDVAVIAYGESRVAELASPSLTTVRPPSSRMGTRSFAIMHDLIRAADRDLPELEEKMEEAGHIEHGPEPTVEILEGELIFRGSCPKC